MSGQEQHIDRLFSDKLREFEIQPPAEVWLTVSDQLERHKKQGTIGWLRVALAASIVAFAMITGYWIGTRQFGNSAFISRESSAPSSGRSVGTSTSPAKVPFKSPPDVKNIQEVPYNPLSQNILAKGLYEVRELYESESTSLQKESENETIAELPPLDARTPWLTEPAMAADLPGMGQMLLFAVLPDEEGIVVENKSSELHQGSQFLLGGQAGPVLAYRDVQNHSVMASAGSVSQNSRQSFSSEEPLQTYGGGLQMQWNISRRLGIATGIGYFGMGLRWKENLFAQAKYNLDRNIVILSGGETSSKGISATTNSLGTVSSIENLADRNSTLSQLYNNSFTPVNFTQHFGFLEIPLILRYRILDRRFGVFLSSGVINHILVHNEVIMKSSGITTSVGSTDGIRKLNYSGTAGLGLDYSLNRFIRLSLEPSFKYNLNPAYSTSSYSTRLYSFGVFSGLTFAF